MGTKDDICGTVLGEMTVGTIQMPMVCGKVKGHPVSEGHMPAAPQKSTGMPSDAALKAFGAGIPRPVAASPNPLPLSMRLRRKTRTVK